MTASASSRPRSVRTARPAARGRVEQPAADGPRPPRRGPVVEQRERQPLAQPQPSITVSSAPLGVVELLASCRRARPGGEPVGVARPGA